MPIKDGSLRTAADDAREKRRIIDDVKAHIRKYGPVNYKFLFDRHTPKPINARMLWRYVRIAMTELETEVIEDTREAVKGVGALVPVDVSMSQIMDGGNSATDALVGIDFAYHLNKCFRDVEMLRNWAVTKDKNGKEVIKNPMYFAAAKKMRESLLKTSHQCLKDFNNAAKLNRFTKAVAEAIRECDPELRKKISERLVRIEIDALADRR